MRRTMSSRLTAVGLLLCLAAAALAQGPNASGTYYQAAHGKKGAELKTALHDIIKNPGVVSYSGLKAAYMLTDVRPDGYLRDFYSCITSYVPGSDMAPGEYEGYSYNREHTVCQSWFKSQSPMYSDVMQVIPTDAYLNSRRNDNPFGEVADNPASVNTSAGGYSKWGMPGKDLGAPAAVTTVFEPNDEVKGDIARIYFYMATCYQDRATTFTEKKGQYVFNADGTAWNPLQPWVLSMMMRWSAQDPVDAAETARNNAAFAVQGNRNPFVDYPGLEQLVWGNRQDEPFDYGGDSGQEAEASASGTILLNSTFFGVDWTGVRPTGGAIQMTGKAGGITVTYAKGEKGTNMYCNDRQIRLYKYNTLTLTVSDNTFVSMQLDVVANASGKTVYASTGTMKDDYRWEGYAGEVQFTVDEGNGNVQLAGITVGLATTAGLDWLTEHPAAEGTAPRQALFDLPGRRLSARPSRGCYVKGGRKYVVR